MFTSVLFLVLNTLTALAGGFLLMYAPDGSAMQMPFHWIEGTVFKDYFIPGLILFLCNGLFGVVVLLLILRRSKWASKAILAQGLVLMVWIIAQISILHLVNMLHITFLIIGFFLIAFGYFLDTTKAEHAGQQA